MMFRPYGETPIICKAYQITDADTVGHVGKNESMLYGVLFSHTVKVKVGDWIVQTDAVRPKHFTDEDYKIYYNTYLSQTT